MASPAPKQDAASTDTTATTATAGRPLAGQHAFVTGGGRGIGAAIADLLAGNGAALTLAGRSRAPLDETAARLAAAHDVEAGGISTDVTDGGQVKASLEQAAGARGPVSILINNAGGTASAPFPKTTPELWDETLDLNLTSIYRVTHAALPPMLEAGQGRIVNVASTAGLKGYGYVAAYCAAKHGVVGLTRALALELAKTDITVNAVCPGFTDTDLVADSIDTIMEKTGRSADDARKALASNNPQGRLIEPREVAEAVLWLCLPGSGAITGQAIAVAGGEVM